MAPFPFNRLPAELRLLIWDEVLLEESFNRIVLVIFPSKRIVPFKHLASPMLSVNREGRACAIKFYDVKLTVSHFPAHFTGVGEFGRVSEMLDADKGTVMGCGSLYVSLQYDIVLSDFNLKDHRDPFEVYRHLRCIYDSQPHRSRTDLSRTHLNWNDNSLGCFTSEISHIWMRREGVFLIRCCICSNPSYLCACPRGEG